MAKDNVELICSISELAACFEESDSLAGFLSRVVAMVGAHMHATVCSVYLYDDAARELVLRATHGLSQDAIGSVRLGLDEGIAGQALRTLRPVCESVGSESPYFKHIPGIAEEAHQAFLAVPILRGLNRVGVLVVQHTEAGYFNETDVNALRAIASQLASTIEYARTLLSVENGGHLVGGPAVAESPPVRFVRGHGVSDGVACGCVAILGRGASLSFADVIANVGEVELDGEAFERALLRSSQQLEALQQRMEVEHADVSASLIFGAQLLMLHDGAFTGQMRTRMSSGESVLGAVAAVLDSYVSLFAASPVPHLREKVQDISDLGHRLMQNLVAPEARDESYSGRIVISEDLLPSDAMRLAAEDVGGIVLLSGNLTSHSVVLARALGIPMVIAAEPALLDIAPGTLALMDGSGGQVHIDPDEDVKANFARLCTDRAGLEALCARAKPETRSADGVRVNLLANVNLLSELETARRVQAEGVGLYRSEYPFIVRSQCPTEQEQLRVYKSLFEAMDGKPVVLRTLDVGGDKTLAYLAGENEDNPFMGLRAIRFSLLNQGIFREQLRAMLRAGAGCELRILFPMIGSVDDFRLAASMLRECIDELGARDIDHCSSPHVGAMIELPSAVELADELAAEADFLSIGSNDLVQYMLAVDRTNPQIAHYYTPHHPSVLRALKRVVNAARLHGKPLSLCGEIARDLSMLPFLLGVGFRSFSMEAASIPVVQQAVSSLVVEECEETARRALSEATIAGAARVLGINAADSAADRDSAQP